MIHCSKQRLFSAIWSTGMTESKLQLASQRNFNQNYVAGGTYPWERKHLTFIQMSSVIKKDGEEVSSGNWIMFISDLLFSFVKTVSYT